MGVGLLSGELEKAVALGQALDACKWLSHLQVQDITRPEGHFVEVECNGSNLCPVCVNQDGVLLILWQGSELCGTFY